jgi:predicted nucleotidyltransferase
VSFTGLEVDLDRIAEVCQRYGSVGRGDERPQSDVDVLYELAPGALLGWEIEDLADELSAVLGRPVDLVSRRALHERLREAVLAEARLLYAA